MSRFLKWTIGCAAIGLVAGIFASAMGHYDVRGLDTVIQALGIAAGATIGALRATALDVCEVIALASRESKT